MTDVESKARQALDQLTTVREERVPILAALDELSVAQAKNDRLRKRVNELERANAERIEYAERKAWAGRGRQ